MSKAKFQKFISSLDESDLKNELKLLYSKFKEVKNHYAMELGEASDRAKIYSKAKKDILNLYYIRGLPRKRPRIQKLKGLLKNLEANSVFKHEAIDIYLYATEVAVGYLVKRPSTTKATFNSCVDFFTKALMLINEFSLALDFEERCQVIVQDAQLIYTMDLDFNDLYNKYL